MERYNAIFGIAPKDTSNLQHTIRFVQKAKGFEYWFISHVGICGVADTMIEMAWPLGKFGSLEEKYGKDYDIYLSRYKFKSQDGLYSAGVDRIVGYPYGGLQLFGILFKYAFRWDIYDSLPTFVKPVFKVCSEAVGLSCLDIGIDFQPNIAPDYYLPAAFFKPCFEVEKLKV